MDEVLNEGLADADILGDGIEEREPVVFIEPEFNYHWDCTKPHNPYAYTAEANPNTFPPTCAVRHTPEFIEGKWPCMKDGRWIHVVDNRGVKIWNTETHEQKDNAEVVIPDGWTDKEPPTKLHKWTQRGWTITKANRLVLDAEQAAEDEAVAKASIASLRAECDRDILPLQDAVDLDEATAEEADRLKALKRCRIALSRWKYPEEIPTKP